MNGIIFYSNTNQSRALAAHLSGLTGWKTYDLHCSSQAKAATESVFDRAVLVFPVHCQNLPCTIAEFLKTLHAERLAVVATYGKMCHGNVLYEVQKGYKAGKIIAAAYVPMQHAYLPGRTKPDYDALQSLAQKLTAPDPIPVQVPRSYKNPLADLFPAARSRMGVSMYLDASKCKSCKSCENNCLHGGIESGKFTNRCIRCLKCAADCPVGAISHRNRLPMRLYLKKRPTERVEVYL